MEETCRVKRRYFALPLYLFKLLRFDVDVASFFVTTTRTPHIVAMAAVDQREVQGGRLASDAMPPDSGRTMGTNGGRKG